MRQTAKQTDSETDRQTDMQTDRHAHHIGGVSLGGLGETGELEGLLPLECVDGVRLGALPGRPVVRPHLQHRERVSSHVFQLGCDGSGTSEGGDGY